MKNVYALVLSAIMASMFSIRCGADKDSYSGVISFYTGTATIQKSDKIIRPVQVKDLLTDGDIIETGDRSYVIIQVGEELVIRIEANTNVSVNSITDKTKRIIDLKKGKVLSRVAKLKKGDEYSIRTQSVIASVRGTRFLTEYSENRSVVAVGDGTVSVIKSKTSETNSIEKGKSIVVSDKTELREINRIEALELKKLDTTPVLKDINKMTGEELNKNYENTISNDIEINKEIEKIKESSGMSFEEMKAKYQRIDVITMYSGKVVKGIILNRGKTFEILTPDGIITVQAKDVLRTGVL